MPHQDIVIRVQQNASGSWSLTATLSRPHRGGRGIRWVPMRTVTRTLKHPYASELTEGILTEWVTAMTLVAAGFYEDVPLALELDND